MRIKPRKPKIDIVVKISVKSATNKRPLKTFAGNRITQTWPLFDEQERDLAAKAHAGCSQPRPTAFPSIPLRSVQWNTTHFSLPLNCR